MDEISLYIDESGNLGSGMGRYFLICALEIDSSIRSTIVKRVGRIICRFKEKNNIPKNYSAYTHSYLPISSVEKYLYKVIVKKSDQIIKKRINDTFFSVQSLDNLLADYYSKECYKDGNGKKLYKLLVGNLTKRGITEEVFVKGLCSIILQYQNFDILEKFLVEHLSVTK